MSELSGSSYFAYGRDGATVNTRGIADASDGLPYVALWVVGPEGQHSGEVYLNPGHVEQLEVALRRAKSDAGGIRG